DRAAPDTGGPVLELPAERDMPAMTLPRETAIENPLRQIASASATAIGGYGELTLNAPAIGRSVVDLRRLVLFVGHNFTDHLRFYSELEVEHAVSSADDQGEFEVEQAYLDGLFNRHFNLRGGLIIMPVGIINVYHEPPTFDGVDRPDVDTLVIPSTWREAGFGVFGEIATGLSYQVYAVTSFDANGFTAASGIAEGHQEAQLAYAGDGGLVARLTYEPVLATIFGLSGYAATSGNDLRGTVGRVPLGLVEADARTRYRGFSARAELAFLFIGDTDKLNAALAAGTADQMMAGTVASQLRGGYVDVGYDVLRLLAPASDQDLTLFFRYDYANTQASVPAGFAADPTLIRYTETVGLVYRPIPEIGLKSDYRRHEFGAGPSYNEYAAAITWMF
ncbi:MAG TPA: hypothetical protein VHO06_20910, partial [Polyangia bacterium]|nr:hypothetical protein [Polyangia bacterium]